MSDIRYLCLSDMHFGEDNSLLTDIKPGAKVKAPPAASPVMKGLVKCLRELIGKNEDTEKKPTLVLNGDILEMALCTTNEAAMVFERFFELIMKDGEKRDELFDKIIYIPGNHDHHLWETARETQYINYVGRHVKWGQNLGKPWHTTDMFVDDAENPTPSYFLTRLAERFYGPQDSQTGIHVAYPNFGLLSEDRKKSVIFCHGHYIEPLYHLMSELKEMLFPKQKKAEQIWQIETENFAWIDFFWSSMGRSGEVGEDVEWIYEKMSSEEGIKDLIERLSDGLAVKLDIPYVPERWEDEVIGKLLTFATDQFSSTEKKKTEKDLSDEAEEGLKEYMQVPLLNQIKDESKRNKREVPDEVTFIFGHTHKPFEKVKEFTGYAKKKVDVYNSGGWVVESAKNQPLHGGSVILVDDELNTAAVRLYNESTTGYSVSVKDTVPAAGGAHNDLYKHLEKIVDPAAPPWKEFSDVVSEGIEARRKRF